MLGLTRYVQATHSEKFKQVHERRVVLPSSSAPPELVVTHFIHDAAETVFKFPSVVGKAHFHRGAETQKFRALSRAIFTTASVGHLCASMRDHPNVVTFA